MKLTDDIVKALQGCIEESCESISDFSKLANVSAATIRGYLNRTTNTIKDETWEKIYPLIKGYLPGGKKSSGSAGGHGKPVELTTDQKVLLDTFAELSKDEQKKILSVIINQAREKIKKK